MQEIAEELRRRREELGKSLEEAQAATKIRLRYLQALEAAEPDQIPGEVYVKGFLRAYGDFLGLDGWALVERYKAWRRDAGAGGEDIPATWAEANEVSPVSRILPRMHALLAHPRRSGRRRPISGRGLALRIGAALLVLAVGFAVWASLRGTVRQDSLPAARPGGEAGEATTPAGPGSTGGAGQPLPGAGSAPSGPVVDPGAPAGTGAESSPGGSSPGTPPAQVTVESEYGERAVSYLVKGAETIRVQADLVGNCWVRVVADGRELETGTLRPGDRRTWEAGRLLEVQAGLPASLRLTVNGVAVDPLAGARPVNLTFRTGS